MNLCVFKSTKSTTLFKL